MAHAVRAEAHHGGACAFEQQPQAILQRHYAPTFKLLELYDIEEVYVCTDSLAERGLTVADLSAAQKKELKLKGGVRVVSAEGAAARAGLQEGDVLLALANVELASVKDFEAVLAKVDKTKPVNVLVRRGEWAQYVLIRPAR